MSNSARNKKAKDLGGSHPQELRREHRQFLARSVDRNDVDLAALLQLNRSLRKARAQILESCGELVLLDLGGGRLTLVNDELHLEKQMQKQETLTQTTKPPPTLEKEEAEKKSDEPVTTSLPTNEKKEVEEEDEEEEYTLTPAQRDMCIDFLWRMKLRRKLLNRLSRRLNRTAQAMDGSDVNPPPPPRYGDLRLHIDPAAVESQSERWERQALALRRIEETKLAPVAAPGDTTTTDVVVPPKESTSSTSPPGGEPPAEVTSTVPEAEEPKEAAKENNTATAPAVPTEDTTTATVETKAQEHAPEATTSAEAEGKEEPKPMEVEEPSATPAESSPSDPPAEAPASGSTTVETTTTPAATTSTESPAAASGPDMVESATEKQPTPDEPPSLQDEYQIIREYEEAYDKVWDKESMSFKYVLAKEEVTPDYTSIKAGAGIGATTRLLSEQERQQEHRRWQTALLSRIPNQPTFEDLGLKNRVFCLEARRKRCLEEGDEDDEEEKAGEEPESKKAKENDEESAEGEKQDTASETGADKKKEKNGDDGSDSDMFGDDDEDGKKEKAEAMDTKAGDDSSDMFGDESDENEKVTEKKEDGKPETEKKIKLEPRKKKEEEKEEEQPEEPIEQPKRKKPMSLVAVPSFYEQDLLRIRAVHGDLLSTSILDHARRQLADTTNEYNAAHRLSNQLYDHRTRLQQNLAYFMARSKTELAKVSGDYALQVAMAKQRWLKQKLEHDLKRSQQFLPSVWGRAPFGTTATQNYHLRGGVAGVVGACMADLVDGAIIMAEGKIPNQKFDDFVPPPPPHTNNQAGESLAQQHARMEAQLKRQMNEITIKLQASEEDRQRTWTKMMKTKAETDPTPIIIPGRRVRLDVTNYHLVPLPPLRNSAQQAVPRDYSRAAVASYTPPANISASDSKYSAASVRERISSDGTVRTVQEPKKTKDGLYMRPAGRTRKGMQWDAVNGIWVPEGSQ